MNDVLQNILDTSEPRPEQNRRPGRRKHTKDPALDILVFLSQIFWHSETFPKMFRLQQKVPFHFF